MIKETRPIGEVRLTPRKLRAALALLGWTVRDLGHASGVGHRPIRLWERGLHRDGNDLAAHLHSFLAAAGVEFHDDGSTWLSDEGGKRPFHAPPLTDP
ncbi:MAG TPA: hypothetical protein VGE72_19305 [Azospirillum sp.]